jgi:rSAM/selenodomain-associated transferase 2/rSAM/selenodomain-associated transferase 1
MLFSVIIPTLNEESAIHSCLTRTKRLGPDVEIIVADGGSTDSTVKIARQLGVRVCKSPRGRGIQCNAGADIATGDVLVFLHVDTRLPDAAFQNLRQIFSSPRVQCGTFRISFDLNHWFLRFLSFMSQFDLGVFRFGDQCLVVRKSFFQSVGGFPDWRLFEDIEFVRRARRKSRIRRFPMTVATSARRFQQNGVIRQHAKNTWYTVRYLLGTSPEELAARYECENRNLRRAFVIMMARYPEPGKVKTRLAVTLGDRSATDFYRTCAAHVVSETAELPGAVRREVWYTGGTEEQVVDWIGAGPHFVAQPDGDLGTRLSFALDRSFLGGSDKSIVIATDVPDLSAKVIVRAFRALQSADVVIGPTFDGGYYLIGMKQPHPGLFQGISWSTDVVCQQTLAAARRLGITVRCLPVLSDIDTRDDLIAWLSRSRYRSPVNRFARALDLKDA